MKQTISLFLLSVISSAAQAQNLEAAFKAMTAGRGSDDFVARCITPELSIIRQQYRLRYGEDYYGKNNMPYYGESYSLAVKVAGGTYLTSRVLEPWSVDDDYQQVAAAGKYAPELYYSYRRALNDSCYSPIDFELGSDYVTAQNSSNTLWLHEDVKTDFGLTPDYQPGEKDGYLIWAYTASNAQDSTMNVTLKQTPFATDTTPDTLVTLAPSDPERVLGGLYVIPRIERGGRVQLFLAGVAVPFARGWALEPLYSEEKSLEKNQDECASSDTKENADPTPIKKK